jgi:hypothetical protein
MNGLITHAGYQERTIVAIAFDQRREPFETICVSSRYMSGGSVSSEDKCPASVSCAATLRVSVSVR